MTLKSTRTLEDLRPVLKDPFSVGPNVVYRVFTNLENPGWKQWINMTQIGPGIFQDEYAKTFGHYHNNNNPETYFVEEGNGVLELQKGFEASEVLLIKAQKGDRVVIPVGYGHAWINTGNADLVLLDDWATPHSPEDYKWIEDHHGLAYYITDGNSKVRATPNPNYKNLPEPKWLTAKEFNEQKL
ncbi:cupin domain-containing protein [Patescibacteria group bacterium]|nr:cupin domain-containing protein [Patescibacteria group bacterium]